MKFLFLSSFAHLAINPNSTQVSGGAELQVGLLSMALADRGHEVVVVGGDAGQPDQKVIRGVRLRVGGKFHTGGIADTTRAIPLVFRCLREERPDYVVVLGWTTWLLVLFLFKAWNSYQLVFICGLDTEVNGGFRRENPFRGAAFEYAVKRADYRFAMTEYQREQFLNSGLTCGYFRNLILDRDSPVQGSKDIDFLWVARGRALKRPHRFLDLVERFSERKCVMICPNEDDELWQSIARRADVIHNLEFHNSVPYRDIQGYYDRASVFVNTSQWEGFPNSFIQAGQGECAILSLEVDSDGMLDGHGAGLSCKGDFESFVRAAERLIDDQELLKQSQSNSKKFVTQFHNNSTNVDAFLEGLSQS